MVERQLPKLNVAGSNPVSRSSEKSLDFVDVSTISGFFLLKISQRKCIRTCRHTIYFARNHIKQRYLSPQGGASYTAVSDSESRSPRATAYENLHGKHKGLPHLDAESVFFASL